MIFPLLQNCAVYLYKFSYIRDFNQNRDIRTCTIDTGFRQTSIIYHNHYSSYVMLHCTYSAYRL